MAETLGPTTELMAVNELLASIGEAPLSSLSSMPPDATTAQDALYRSSRNLQAIGWHFNSDYDVELTPDGSDEIVLGTNVLKIDADSKDVTPRGDSGVLKLWDRKDQQFTFATITTLKVDIIYHFVWLDLPQHVRSYVIVLAIKDFLLGFPGHTIDRGTAALLEHKFQKVQNEFYTTENFQADGNMLSNSSISSILRRT